MQNDQMDVQGPMYPEGARPQERQGDSQGYLWRVQPNTGYYGSDEVGQTVRTWYGFTWSPSNFRLLIESKLEAFENNNP